MLDTAVAHYTRQARITALGLTAARRAREQGNTDRLLAVVLGAQLAAVMEAVEAVPAMLAEQGIAAEPVVRVDPAAIVGVASDGRDLASLLVLAETAAQFDRIVETQLQDVARNAASVAIAARPQVTGYVRMINPGACSRCVVQAGKWFRWNEGFQRHPQCGCRHVPARENTAGDMTTDPAAYFDSLSGVEQDRVFTKAGAQAIRDGADMGRVVNARAGMSTAQVPVRGRGDRWSAKGQLTTRDVYGQRLATTTEATGARGVPGRSGRARLMPESIYRIATDRDDAIRLLTAHGYVRD